MTDIANLSETMRQGEATRAALGLQMRARPLWSGAGRFSGVTERFVNPYRMRGVNSPDSLYENIIYNGTVYVATVGLSEFVYTSTNLRDWTARSAGSGHSVIGDSLVAAGSLLLLRTKYSSSNHYRTSVDNGVTWVMGALMDPIDPVSAGGIGYTFGLSASTAFKSFTPANPGGTNQNFATAQQWVNVLYNGTRWLAVNSGASVAERSANGLDGWVSSAGLTAAIGALPAGARTAYTVGGRFVLLSLVEGAISTIYSPDGDAWSLGTLGEFEPNGLRVAAVGAKGAELSGVLYIPVQLTSGTDSWNAFLATPDGVQFKWLPAFWKGSEGLPTVACKADGSGLIFNAAKTGAAARRYETNPNALEIYLAV